MTHLTPPSIRKIEALLYSLPEADRLRLLKFAQALLKQRLGKLEQRARRHRSTTQEEAP